MRHIFTSQVKDEDGYVEFTLTYTMDVETLEGVLVFDFEPYVEPTVDSPIAHTMTQEEFDTSLAAYRAFPDDWDEGEDQDCVDCEGGNAHEDWECYCGPTPICCTCLSERMRDVPVPQEWVIDYD